LACCLLPKAHRDTMEVLFAFLKWASSFSQVDEESGSKMDIHNLSTVMAPNILYSNLKAPPVDDSFLAIEAVNMLIETNETFCQVLVIRSLFKRLLPLTHIQVPEDLQSILTDSSLHNSSADLTTKEILSRYGDIVKGNIQTSQRTVQGPDAPAQGPLSTTNSNRSANGPVATRVDVNPYQATAWQKQSSARPVQNAASGASAPQHDFNFNAPSSSYDRDRSGSQGSQGSHGTPSARQSYQPRSGAMGVTT